MEPLIININVNFTEASKSTENSSPITEPRASDDNDDLCYDEWSGRFFRSSLERIELAVSKANAMIMESGVLALNEFYELLGLPRSLMGESLGWSGTKISVRTGSALSPQGRPALSFWFLEEPRSSWGLR